MRDNPDQQPAGHELGITLAALPEELLFRVLLQPRLAHFAGISLAICRKSFGATERWISSLAGGRYSSNQHAA